MVCRVVDDNKLRAVLLLILHTGNIQHNGSRQPSVEGYGWTPCFCAVRQIQSVWKFYYWEANTQTGQPGSMVVFVGAFGMF